MYAKVFTQILDSSIAENYQVRHVFEDLLKLCDMNGVVDMTHESIARRLNVPLDMVVKCITELEKPDPSSRTQDHEGKRLARIDEHRDWGWIIVNHAYYRNLASDEQRREKTRVRVANFKSKSKQVTQGNAVVTPTNAGNAMQKHIQMQDAEADTKAERESMWREKPSLKEVQFQADRIGLAAWKAEDWWHEMEGGGWLDHNHRPIHKWISVLTRLKLKWETDGRPAGPPASRNGKPKTASVYELQTILKAKESTAQEIKGKFSSEAAMGTSWSDEGKREEWRKLRKEIKELTAKISNHVH